MKSYTVKENHISSVVSEIIRYKQTGRYTDRQTHRQIDILLLLYKNNSMLENVSQDEPLLFHAKSLIQVP